MGFSAPTAIELYAVFDEEGALDQLEAFASLNGPAFYELPLNNDTIRLSREPTQMPGSVVTPEGEVIQVFHLTMGCTRPRLTRSLFSSSAYIFQAYLYLAEKLITFTQFDQYSVLIVSV